LRLSGNCQRACPCTSIDLEFRLNASNNRAEPPAVWMQRSSQLPHWDETPLSLPLRHHRRALDVVSRRSDHAQRDRDRCRYVKGVKRLNTRRPGSGTSAPQEDRIISTALQKCKDYQTRSRPTPTRRRQHPPARHTTQTQGHERHSRDSLSDFG